MTQILGEFESICAFFGMKQSPLEATRLVSAVF